MLSRIQRTLAKRQFSTLHDKFEALVPAKREQLLRIKKNLGDKVLGEVKVANCIGGMRGLKAMAYDTSSLDHEEGIRFKGWTIPDIQERCQSAPGGEEPLPEAVFWLLLTGEFPTDQELAELQGILKERAQLPQETVDLIKAQPIDTHPMSDLSIAVLSLQRNSKFAEAYRSGVPKTEYWRTYLDDSIDLVAKITTAAALIYNQKYRGGVETVADPDLDWAGNYAHMMGYEREEIKECIRGYLAIHSDHEGGNVSAHAYHLISSALSDPYLSFSGAINGLAGPLHGLANQEVLRFLIEVRETLGDHPTDEQLLQLVKDTLAQGKVIPGYGHAVLRNTDPRYTHQKKFAAKYIKDDPLVNLTAQCFRVIPPHLQSLGKVANPWPNVDAHSGVLLYHYGKQSINFAEKLTFIRND